MSNKTNPVGRPTKKESKRSYSVSMLPSEAEKLKKKYGTLTKAINTIKP